MCCWWVSCYTTVPKLLCCFLSLFSFCPVKSIYKCFVVFCYCTHHTTHIPGNADSPKKNMKHWAWRFIQFLTISCLLLNVKTCNASLLMWLCFLEHITQPIFQETKSQLGTHDRSIIGFYIRQQTWDGQNLDEPPQCFIFF